jgi:non-ribosomal peptide synthetase component F
MTALAAYKILLGWYTQIDDIALSTYVAGRNPAETGWLVGEFAAQLVLRTDLTGDPTFRQLLARVHNGFFDSSASQHLPVEIAMRMLYSEQNLNHLSQLLFIFVRDVPAPLRLPEIAISSLEIDSVIDETGLNVELWDTAQGLSFVWLYDSARFSPVKIEAMSNNLRSLLEEVVSRPDVRLSALKALLSDRNRQAAFEREHEAEQAAIRKLRSMWRKGTERS